MMLLLESTRQRELLLLLLQLANSIPVSRARRLQVGRRQGLRTRGGRRGGPIPWSFATCGADLLLLLLILMMVTTLLLLECDNSVVVGDDGPSPPLLPLLEVVEG